MSEAKCAHDYSGIAHYCSEGGAFTTTIACVKCGAHATCLEDVVLLELHEQLVSPDPAHPTNAETAHLSDD